MQFRETPVIEQTNKTYSKIYQRTFETKYAVLSYFWHYAKQYKTDIAEPLKVIKTLSKLIKNLQISYPS